MFERRTSVEVGHPGPLSHEESKSKRWSGVGGRLVGFAGAVSRSLRARGSVPHRRALADSLTPPKVLRFAADAAIVLIALAVAQALRHGFHTTLIADASTDHLSLTLFSLSNIHSSIMIVLISVAVFALNGFYTYGSTYQGRFKLLIIAQAVTISFLVVASISFMFPALIDVSRSVLLVAWVVAGGLLVCSRMWSSAWRYVLAVESARAMPASVRVTDRPSVLVIGGGGYIGSALLPKLLGQGNRVRVLDLLVYGEEPISNVLHHPDLEVIKADFRQIDALVKSMQDIQEVVHLGGLVGDPACACNEDLTIDINLAATRAVAEVASGAGVRRLVFASTCSVYGASDEVLDERSQLNPLSLYARSKVASERVLLQAASDTFAPIMVRFSTVHGLSGRTRFDLVVNLLAAKAVLDGEITIMGGAQWRPFLHVDDAAQAVAMLLRSDAPALNSPCIFNVGSNDQNYTIQQVGEMVQRQVPAARLIDLPSDAERRNYRVNFDNIEREIGFRSRYTVEDGIAQVIKAIRTGQISDYRKPAYSNLSFLTSGGAAFFTPPRPEWARELIAEAGS